MAKEDKKSDKRLDKKTGDKKDDKLKGLNLGADDYIEMIN